MDSADCDGQSRNVSIPDLAVLMVSGPCVVKLDSFNDANNTADELRERYRVGEYGVRLRVKFDDDIGMWVVANRKDGASG